MVSLINKGSNKPLWCYPRTLSAIIDVLPTAFECAATLESDGPNMTYLEKEVYKYGNKKIMVYVKRWENRVTVRAQMLFDRENAGDCIKNQFKKITQLKK